MPTVTETYTSETSWTVPSYVSEVTVKLYGEPGGSGDCLTGGYPAAPATSQYETRANGGNGGYAEGTLSVSSGDTLYIRFATGGAGGYAEEDDGIWAEGGKGGDATWIGHNSTSWPGIAVAGGGGGGGGARMSDGASGSTDSGPGGSGGQSPSAGTSAITPNLNESGGNIGASSDQTGVIGDSAVRNTWDIVAGGGGGAAGYNIGGGGGQAGYFASPEEGAAAGGAGGGNYLDGSLTSTTSETGTSTTRKVEIEYQVPLNPTATAVSGDQIDLAWTDRGDSYNVYRALSSGSTLSEYTQIASGLTTPSYSDTGLLDGERYYYRVTAIINGSESTASTEVAATTPLPAPTGLRSTGASSLSVEVAWSATHDNGETRIEVKPSNTTTWQSNKTVTRSTEMAIADGLRNGEEYDVRVVATTEHVDSPSTDPIGALTISTGQYGGERYGYAN